MKILLVGGVGGSGTRVVAQLLADTGCFIGSNLNVSLDNLDWPGNPKLIQDKSIPFDEKLASVKESFVPFFEKMYQCSGISPESNQYIVIKVPGSFYYLPYLASFCDDIRYIHTIRNGFDMAFSQNKNQLFNWGGFYNIRPNNENVESCQLKYWLKANEYALRQCETYLDKRYLVVKFEDLCFETFDSLERIILFAGLQADHEFLRSMAESVKTPESMGRYKSQMKPGLFGDDDIKFVSRFGYQLEN